MKSCFGLSALVIFVFAIVFAIKAVLGLYLLSLLVPGLITFSFKNCVIFFFLLACISFKVDLKDTK